MDFEHWPIWLGRKRDSELIACCELSLETQPQTPMDIGELEHNGY